MGCLLSQDRSPFHRPSCRDAVLMFSAFDLQAVVVAGLALVVAGGVFLASLRRARDHGEVVLRTPRDTETALAARRAALTLVPQTDPTPGPRPSEDARTASRVP